VGASGHRTIGGISILLPLTFGVNPTSAMILMAGIYCGAMYGGTITSVLIIFPARPHRL